MERKDPQPDEQQPMAQPKDEPGRKPKPEDEEKDKAVVGKVPDPQGENSEQKRDQA